MRALLFLATGLAAGIIGALLFQQSFPPDPGSPAARIDLLEREVNSLRITLANTVSGYSKPAVALGASQVIEDFKAGRPVDVDELFQATKPILRDFAPFFDRLRRKDLNRHMEDTVAEYTRKYHLSPARQEALRNWMKTDREAQLAAAREYNLRDSTSFEDMIRASSKPPSSKGLDTFMESSLSGSDLTAFKNDRLQQRLTRVQDQADRRVSRLNAIVPLDETQQDQVFSLMARSSPDFDPAMQLEGVGTDTGALAAGQDRDAAIVALLRPDQREAFEIHRAGEMQKSAAELNELGFKLPDDWDFLGDN